jgi:hypothetical protein
MWFSKFLFPTLVSNFSIQRLVRKLADFAKYEIADFLLILLCASLFLLLWEFIFWQN